MTRDAIKINWFAQTFRSDWRFVQRSAHPRPAVVPADAVATVADASAVLLLDVVVRLSSCSLNVSSVRRG